MSVSQPQTPRKSKAGGSIASGSKSLQGTPKSIKRRTVLDPNSSYIEEEDETYVFNESTVNTSEADLDDYSEILEEELDLDTDEGNQLARDKQAIPEAGDNPTDNSTEVEQKQPSRLREFLVKHEIIRKGLHASIGPFTLWMYTLGINQKQFIPPLSLLFIVIFIQDYIRLHNPQLNAKIVKTWWFLIRESEVNSYNGVLWYLSGLVLVFCFAPKDVSLMSVLLLSWADTAASTFGRQYGKYTPKILPGKSLAGTFASFVTGVLSCYLVYAYFIPVYNEKVNVPGDIYWSVQSSNLNLHYFAILSGIVAGASELVTFYNMDDNFSIPVLSGVFLYGAVRYFHV